MQQTRVGFVTCVEIGLSCLQEIVAAGGALDCVLTLHDHLARGKSGRVYLDEFCAEHGIPLFKLRNINDPDALDFLGGRGLDWLFIIGWSQIAGDQVLKSARHGVLGAHPTLLPVGRGRAAIPWAILKRLPETGVTLFQLDEGVDTGPVLAQERIPLSAQETATVLYQKVAEAHRALIRHAWPEIVSGRITPRPQDDSLATVWPGRTAEDGLLDPAMRLDEVEVLVRAVTRPYPGAYLPLPGGRLRIWAGRVAGDVEAGNSDAGRVLGFSDGRYLATDSRWEPHPA